MLKICNTRSLLSTAIMVLHSVFTLAQVQTLDGFESKAGWDFIRSDGVTLDLSVDQGLDGNAVRFDYDFTKGTGYGGIQKFFPIDLPENYEFTFWLKAESPANNFEIKFIDSSGNNVWWVNNRNYEFPGEWKKIRIKKRHISFAWGPTEDQPLRRIDRIEFTVASFVGGKGTLWIDGLTFETLPPEVATYPPPRIEATSSVKNHPPELMLDNSDTTWWQTKSGKDQQVFLDFTMRREFGGLEIHWLEGQEAHSFEVLLSNDAKTWETAYSIESFVAAISFVRLPEAEARYLKLIMSRRNTDEGIGIRELKILDTKSTLTLNDFLTHSAKNSPRGHYPRYFHEEASYWTVTGVNNDMAEALINEDGMVEVEKGRFSLEPVLKVGGRIYDWSNVVSVQSLGFEEGKEDFTFRPSVTWDCGDVRFTTSVTTDGEANRNSYLEINYNFENQTEMEVTLVFHQIIRPFQVNPYYQFLNLPGGAGKIRSINYQHPYSFSVDGKVVRSEWPHNHFWASPMDAGNPAELISGKTFFPQKDAEDPLGMATGCAMYRISLMPGESRDFSVFVPFHGKMEDPRGTESLPWNEMVSHVEFNLPPSADRIIDAIRANLVYILINRDHAGIQPGSRSYERSWIRDGSLTSSALLKNGIVTEVRDFIDWYAAHQYENGKVPCVVDFRGPDPVPEHDSHGQLVYLIREYFNFTQDTAFLREKNPNVLMAVGYIESLIAERSTDHYKYGNDSVRAHYGLVPESISHEGYSAKPMHSYWDNFFIMKGLKDAAEIQRILGNEEEYARIAAVRDTFRKNLYNSIDRAMAYKGIDYIPGCVELGDFDATSTTIALTPCNELKNLPRPQVYNTFDKYYAYFKNRRDGAIDWVNYTPYENRLIGSFIILDQPDRAHELIDYFLNDQRPHGFHHWAEVVWKEYRRPGFIGDMPHTWVGSDFINAIRSMFVYENEYDESLVLAAALYQDWIDAPEGMSVAHLPTYYGEISYSILKKEDHYIFKISGDVQLPANGMQIRNFNGSKMPVKVTVNGDEITEFNEKRIAVREFPADIEIYY